MDKRPGWRRGRAGRGFMDGMKEDSSSSRGSRWGEEVAVWTCSLPQLENSFTEDFIMCIFEYENCTDKSDTRTRSLLDFDWVIVMLLMTLGRILQVHSREPHLCMLQACRGYIALSIWCRSTSDLISGELLSLHLLTLSCLSQLNPLQSRKQWPEMFLTRVFSDLILNIGCSPRDMNATWFTENHPN